MNGYLKSSVFLVFILIILNSCAEMERVQIEITDFKFLYGTADVDYQYEVDGKVYQRSQYIGKDVEYGLIFVPKGSKYKMTYNPNRPKGTFSHLILLYHPIYDSTQVFERTSGQVVKEFFRDRRRNLIYGGLQLIFKYEVDGKWYESHNGIKLNDVFPDVENPENELSFIYKKFVIEYDVDNPYIARILLDEEVK